MKESRFGFVEPQRPTPPRYRINYDRLMIYLTLLILLGIGIWWWLDARNPSEEAVLPPIDGGRIQMTDTPSDVSPLVSSAPNPDETTQPPLSLVSGWLPTVTSVNTDVKKIAISIDHCGDADNLQTIMELCQSYNAHITFFPTAEEVESSDLWGSLYFSGHEIESRVWNPATTSTPTIEGVYSAIDRVNAALKNAIGMDYVPGFLRADPGVDWQNEALHLRLANVGYRGIALWAVESPESPNDIAAGDIVLWHGDDEGVNRLRFALPILRDLGYQMVTLNELLG